MDLAHTIEQRGYDRQKDMNAVIGRMDSPVQLFYQGTTVFVTGGSGFVGKQIIEKLFRSTKIKKIYMLIRYKKGKSPEERIYTVLKDPIFDVLHKDQPDFVQKIFPILGDVSESNLGISEKDAQTIIDEVDIIFHMAASIAFDQPLQSAILINVRGTRDLINLAKSCKHLKSVLYISTAYVHATLGRVGEDITEEFYPTPCDPDLMIKMAEELPEEKLLAIQKELITSWPNTYTFSKAAAEELVRMNSQGLPIKIVRPTTIICAYSEPNPGWLDISSVFGPSGLYLGFAMGVIHVCVSRPETKTDLIPSDYVANCSIVAATANNESTKIYTIGSSNRTNLRWRNITNNLRYMATKMLSPKLVWYGNGFTTTSTTVFYIFHWLLHKIPAYIVDGMCILLNKKPRLRKIYGTVEKLNGVLRHFTTHDWIFKDDNTLELFKSLSENDKTIYHFDVADIELTDMLSLYNVGLRRYIIKDELKGTDIGLKKQFYFKMATIFIFLIVLLFIYFCLKFIYNLF